MSQTTAPPPVDAIRFRNLVTAELTKIRTLTATWIALAITTTANTALGIVVATDAIRIAGSDGPVPVAQLGTLMLAPVYIFAAIAVYAAGTEYRAGQLRITLAATPDRARLFAAKLTAATALSTLAAIVAVLPGHLLQHSQSIIDRDLHTGEVATDLLATGIVYVILSLIGFGFAIVAQSVVTPLAVLFITPVLVSPAMQGTYPDLIKFLPHEASLSLLGTPTAPDTELTLGSATMVLTTWAAASLAIAAGSLLRRDS